MKTNLLVRFVPICAFILSALQPASAQQSSEPEEPKAKPIPKQEISALKVPGMKFNKKIPANFPLPVYPRNVTDTVFVHSTSGSPSASATIKTKDAPRDVFDWYKSACKSKGWQVGVPTSAARSTLGSKVQLNNLNLRKGGHQAYIYCLDNKTEGGTTINITWSYQKIGVQSP